jgi:hypothetical protein
MKRILVVLAVIGIAMSAATAMAGKKAMAVKADEAAAAALANGHVLHVEGTEAYLCTCGKDCTCTIAEDGTHCTCGKEIQKVSIAGKYYCKRCDSAISDKPGKCPGCGDELTEAK